ncbi:MAG TPA: 30S ribosomal protein S3 [Candidatus Paceibacterota bacterium]
MSHTVHPYSHRLGILRDWRSRWFTGKGKSLVYRDLLKGDVLTRQFLEKALRTFLVDDIEIERGENSMHVIIKTARPGMIIGRSGEGTAKLKEDLLKVLRKQKVSVPRDMRLIIEEVRSPESHAGIVAHMIEELIEKRTTFRRVLKQTAEKVMANKDVKGMKVTLSGRLDGAEMGRVESIMKGRLPLQTLRADVDFAKGRASMPYGDIGIKVWIYRGQIFEKEQTGKIKIKA